MESVVNGPDSLPKSQNSASTTCSNSPPAFVTVPLPSQSSSLKQPTYENAFATYFLSAQNHCVKAINHPNGSMTNQKHSYRKALENLQWEEVPNKAKHFYSSNKSKNDFMSTLKILDEPEGNSAKKVNLIREGKSGVNYSHNYPERSSTSASLQSVSAVSDPNEGGIGLSNNLNTPHSALSFFPSPSNSVYTATLYTEAKQSFTSEEASSLDKFDESGEVSNSYDIERQKRSICRGTTNSDASDESSSNSFSSTLYKPHKANDTRWEAIQDVRCRVGELGFNHFRLLKLLGGGDIGSVYLAELNGTKAFFALKIMSKSSLASRKKVLRAQKEREILQSLDHPFLPTLYTHFETDLHSCLVMEFCPGGDLYTLRQRQPGKYFHEHAAQFYAAEVLLALEYLHMLGIIYRDLKPENVLVRDDGHIMLSDFDLSLRCAVCPTLVKSSKPSSDSKDSSYCVQPTCVVQPDCIQPACFGPRSLSRSGKPKKNKKSKAKYEMNHQARGLPELIAEPTGTRSMSFVGTHEYLAPEIIKGEGHGSSVDWWTFGIFLYELLFGKTPFKGAGNRATLFNVIGQQLRFPESPAVSFAARDLMRGLLVKEPQHRLAYRRGATEIKQHPFFQSVNWALIRCAKPPEVPRQGTMDILMPPNLPKDASANYLQMDFF
ncbi:hypothetical protein K2173_014194 [Erythroxylum novogranatense]|uniref:non-specific serine/threonine protein kinase n=1 Tax=Erythroxylum novogranatense TaxID=1862640 RepID=A0AAV8SDS1_9ROSI|nr:hypothetical protein K2173_014194 [Erythroxylum novogranatense]